VSDFQNLLKSTVAYIKSFPIKRVVSVSRAETTMLRSQTTITPTAGIPTRPGSLLFLMLVPGAQCNKWTKPDALHFKLKNDHSRAIPLAAKYTLYFCFPDWKCTTCDVIFGLGHNMTGCFWLEVAIGLLAMTWLE